MTGTGVWDGPDALGWKETRGLATTGAPVGCLLGGQFLGVRAH